MKNARVAFIAFYSSAAAMMLVGLVYILRNGPMPYHLAYLGKTLEELDPKVLAMLLIGKNAVGALTLSMAIAVSMLTYHLKEGARWIRWTILLSMTPNLLMFLYITLAVGSRSPWWLIVGLIGLIVVGFTAAAPTSDV